MIAHGLYELPQQRTKAATVREEVIVVDNGDILLVPPDYNVFTESTQYTDRSMYKHVLEGR